MTYAEWIAEFVARHNDFVRGKCVEATMEMVAAFPELRRAGGFIHVFWHGTPTREQHWWCVDPEGNVIDPTRRQFQVVFEYEELDLNDPTTRDRVPTGRCMQCGEDAYRGETFCSKPCEEKCCREMFA